MKKPFYSVFRFILSSSLLLVTYSAHAITSGTIVGANFTDGQSSYGKTFADGTIATFVGSGAFQKKTQAGITGVGIAGGRTAGEIDIGESLTGSFSRQVIVSNLTLALLFNGPEYGDVQEVAKLLVNFSDGGKGTYLLTATGRHTASWDGVGTPLSLGSGAVDGGTGAWQLTNPFGFRSVTSIEFTAKPGVARSSCSHCTNQSDYTFVNMTVTPVPEAHTSAMMLAGLLMIGALTLGRSRS